MPSPQQLRIRGATGRPITTTNLPLRQVQEVDGTRPTWHNREGLNAVFEAERLRQLQQEPAAVQTAATTTNTVLFDTLTTNFNALTTNFNALTTKCNELINENIALKGLCNSLAQKVDKLMERLDVLESKE
ncbi:hypothetical protein BGX38DRAFT_1279528 [Terfezia claveryi]|nr:hypothetical protein BGX38DRAFT_1279528 [Terfezia claveryi]